MRIKLSYKPTLIERLKLLFGPICYTNKKGETHRDIDDGPAMLFKDNHQYFENGVINKIETIHYKRYFDKNGVICKDEYSNYSIHFIPNSNKYFLVGENDYKNILGFYNENITDEVETWLEERNLDYNTITEEDSFAFNFYISSL